MVLFNDILIKKSNDVCPNGRYYPEHVLEEIVKQINNKGSIFGFFCDYEDELSKYSTELDVNMLSHCVCNAKIVNGNLYCDIQVFDNTEGQKLKKMLDWEMIRWAINVMTPKTLLYKYDLPLTVISINGVVLNNE